MKEEIWVDVPEYEGFYKVSNHGRIKSLDHLANGRGGLKLTTLMKGRILKQCPTDDGYFFVRLCKNGKIKNFSSHRLVAKLFIPNPDNKPIINHKDRNRRNNYFENLEWSTVKENIIHGFENRPLKEHGAKGHGIRKLNSIQVLEIVKKYKTGNYSLNDLGNEYKVDFTNISSIMRGKSWKHITHINA